MLADLMDRADVGMIQSGRSTSFTTEPFERLRVLGYVFGKKLQRDETTEVYVLSLVDNTHAATAQLLNNVVVRDGLTDHGQELKEQW